MNFKRITLLAGHYGSGKTNIAINLAFYIKKLGIPVTIADLDIVNPYYRTKDSEKELKDAGIPLIVSRYANTNVDIPALPSEIYSCFEDTGTNCILDIGGDDRGAYALGRYAPMLLEENNYDMLLVVNMYRPLTRDSADTVSIMHEIEAACGISFTGIINNSNLGRETTPRDILASLDYADKISRETSLPVKMTTVHADIVNAPELKDIGNLFPLSLQNKRLW